MIIRLVLLELPYMYWETQKNGQTQRETHTYRHGCLDGQSCFNLLAPELFFFKF